MSARVSAKWYKHSASGAELDLFWQYGGKNWDVEFKYADAPRMTKSMKSVVEDLALEHVWVVYPGKDQYKIADRVTVCPLRQIPERWDYQG
ncbi:MAG: hypothetical protein GY797_24130 [Deltaproteobacteria bacterium]|nr:hypothetical protein [Deltaproteobacteria bacterium]